MLHFSYKNSLLNDKILAEISMLMDSNFAGAIDEYMALYYQNTNIKDITNNVNNIMSYKDTNLYTSAEAYLQEVNFDAELIVELDELESDVLCTLEICQLTDNNLLILSSILFEKYSKILHAMLEFEELSYTLKTLKYLLSNTDIKDMDEETQQNILIYLKAITRDLQSWRKSVFITRDAEDIHYLDKTLLSSIAQLRITLCPTNNGKNEMEFF